MKILIAGGCDYSALDFSRAHTGVKVNDIITDIDSYLAPDGEWELEVVNVPDKTISPELLNFFRNDMMDYDDSKARNFWIEGEIINE